ncbi:MAG: hypothetical protein K6F90_07875 [Lachnospiraceae bacterium]|nr:hypothetical protein [Lachnospiraceae bacterium]
MLIRKRFLLSAIFLIILTGCGQGDTPGVSNDSVMTPVIYSGDIEDKGESLRYELSVNPDGTCEFDQYYLNEDDSYVLYHAVGTAQVTDYGYYVLYTLGTDELYGEVYTDGQTIIGAYSDYLNINNEYSDIVGMYDCASDEDKLLSVDATGRARLAVGDMLYENTQLYLYEGSWDLMIFNESNELLLDWLISFNEDGTFDYVDYASFVYADFEGVYTCDGPLGMFDMTISGQGDAEAVVTIDDKEMDFTGIVTVYEQKIISAFLESDEGYELTLSFSEYEQGSDILPYTASYKINLE